MNPFRIITDSLLGFIVNVVGGYERRLRKKEKQMATMREQIRSMRERLRKMDDVQAAYRALHEKYNALVLENAGNEEALKELVDAFNAEMAENEAAIAEGGKFEPSGNKPFDPSANKPMGGPAVGAKKGK